MAWNTEIERIKHHLQPNRVINLEFIFRTIIINNNYKSNLTKNNIISINKNRIKQLKTITINYYLIFNNFIFNLICLNNTLALNR